MLVESILINRTTSENLEVDDAWEKEMEPDFADTSMEVNLPNSILIAGFGALFGVLGCVSSWQVQKDM